MADIYGTSYNDDGTVNGGVLRPVLEGTSSADRIWGYEGNDKIYGYGGNDTISGGSGQDRIYGGTGNDSINGDSNSDIIYGEQGNDILLGATGNDYIIGGSGYDTLWGNADADKFVFLSYSDGIDTIKDFNAGEGDVIQVDLNGFSNPSLGQFTYRADTGLLSFNLNGNEYGIAILQYNNQPISSQSFNVYNNIEIVAWT